MAWFKELFRESLTDQDDEFVEKDPIHRGA
jgi:hypothetical protein